MSESLNDTIRAAYEQAIEAKEPEVAESVEEVAEASIEPETTEAVETNEAPAIEPDDIEPPEHWSSEDKEVFKSVDRKAKDFLLRRHKEMQSDYTRKQQEHAEQIKFAEKMRGTLSPHEEYLKQYGIDPTVAVERLIQTEKTLRLATPYEKAQAVKDLIQRYGVQLDNVPQGEQPPEMDETTKLILKKIEDQERYIQNLEYQRKAQEQYEASRAIENFKAATDESGNPKYPHFDRVKTTMGELIKSGFAKSTDLAELYEQAILLDKDLRKSYLSQQDVAKQSDDLARQKAVASKRAGAMNVKSASSGDIREARKEETLRQTLERAMAEQTRR